MMAEIDAVKQGRVFLTKASQGFGPAGRECLTGPNFIEAARIALIAADKILGAYAQPARHPDINGIIFAQGTFRQRGRWGFQKRN